MTAQDHGPTNVSGEQARSLFLTHPRWPRFPAACERLKHHPIGPAPQPQPRLGTPEPAPMVDLEPHANYLESP